MITCLFPELAQKLFLVIDKKLCFVDSCLSDWIHATTARGKQASSTTPTRRARASVGHAARVAWREVNDGGGVLFFTALDRLCVVVDSEDFHITFCFVVYNIAHLAPLVKGAK